MQRELCLLRLCPLAYALWCGLVAWMIYRVVRGWLLLKDGKPVPGM